MNNFWITVRMFAWMTLLTGIIYPLVVTSIAYLTMKDKAEGGFIYSNNQVVAANLIAQKFDSNKYFWGRPSSIDYNPLPSGGSNLGPTSADLKKAVDERRERILKSQNIANGKIPSELLFASGSGLDPHISPSTAKFQLERIVQARNLDHVDGKKKLEDLIDQMTTKRLLGFIGKPYVNVVMLNIALDKLANQKSHHE
jgi:K+-transporting ATPase ATPase C chain